MVKKSTKGTTKAAEANPPADIPCTQVEIDEDGKAQCHEMGRITKVIQSWLKEMEWEEKPDIDDEENTSSTGFTYSVSDDFSVKCFLDAAEKAGFIKLFMYFLDSKIPESKITEVIKFANMVNIGIPIGHLAVITEDRQLRYYAAIDVDEAAFDTQHISNLIGAGLRTMKYRLPQFMAICFGGKSAEEAMEIEPE